MIFLKGSLLKPSLPFIISLLYRLLLLFHHQSLPVQQQPCHSYQMTFVLLNVCSFRRNYRTAITYLYEKIPAYIQLTLHQLLFRLGLANGLLMSAGLHAVTGYQQKWLLSIKITFPQVCCLNIPFPNLVTVTEWKTNSRTLESAVIFKTLFLTLHSALNRQPPSLAFRLVITKLCEALLFTLPFLAEYYSFCYENLVSSTNVGQV